MPDDLQAGGTPADPPSNQGGTPGSTPPNDDSAGGTPPGSSADPGRRDSDPARELRSALEAERRERKRLEAETRRLQADIDQHADAGKSEIERERARAARAEGRVSELEAKLAQKEAEGLARQVAAEAGIGHMWERLRGDDIRSLRADATRLREEMGMPGGALDGGVRGVGVPRQQPPSMDELIRSGARRR